MEKRNESTENYLETLLAIEEQKSVIRSIDVANALKVSRASVSRAMNVLKGEGYVNMELYGDVTLTEKGRQTAARVRERHNLLKKFLIENVGVSASAAEEDACRMEHDLSLETFTKLKEYIEKL